MLRILKAKAETEKKNNKKQTISTPMCYGTLYLFSLLCESEEESVFGFLCNAKGVD